jgi:hypothetical protein
MHAIRIDTVIPQNRRLAITVPAEMPVGKAELNNTARSTNRCIARLHKRPMLSTALRG